MLDSEHLKIFAVLSLLLGTVLLFCFSERYVVVGEELLQDSQLLDGASSWTQSDSGVSIDSYGSGVVDLTSKDTSTLTHFSQGIIAPQRFRLLGLSVYMKTLGVHKGDKDWKTARLVLVSRDSKGNEIYYRPHKLVGRYGDNDWKQYRKVFRIDNETEEIHVSAQFMHASGIMWIKDISLVPVNERDAFIIYRGILVALWVLAIAWVIKPIFSNTGMSLEWVFVLVISAGIVSGALLPESIKKYIDRSLLHEVYSGGQSMEPDLSSGASNSPAGSILPEFSIYKFGHFALFSLLAAVAILKKIFLKSQLPVCWATWSCSRSVLKFGSFLSMGESHELLTSSLRLVESLWGQRLPGCTHGRLYLISLGYDG